MTRFEPNIQALIRKVATIANSPLSIEGPLAEIPHSMHRIFDDGCGLSGYSFSEKDAQGFAQKSMGVDYNKARVLECDEVRGIVKVYTPGLWEERINILYDHVPK